MKIDPVHSTKTTIVQQLAEHAANKMIQPWNQIIPSHYHKYAKVFSEDAAQRFPNSYDWDHAIDLKPNTLNTMDCKVYPLSSTKDIALQKFITI